MTTFGDLVSRSYQFGNAELLPVERRLLIDGRLAELGSRAFDVLVALIERRHRVVTKNELLDLVWSGLVVEENNLAAQISTLRKILGARVIATIPGIGYRFCVPVSGDEQPFIVHAEGPPESSETNLPPPTESLIGRDTELADIAAMLDERRLVSIVGAAGIGKTRLAQEAARAAQARFPAGVWWVDLAAIPTNDSVAPVVARAAR